MEFKAWPKMVRLENKRAPIFTEKIDGTNACIVIGENGEFACQSRTRFIVPGDDNFGFAKWAYKNQQELMKMGPGYHYGEWWGLGIQRAYNETEKKFSLFNIRRWGEHNPNTPSCVSVVPQIRAGSVEEAKQILIEHGSFVSKGFMNVEGLIMYEPDTDCQFKIIINK